MTVARQAPAAGARGLWGSVRRDVGWLALGNVAVLLLQLAFRAVLVGALSAAGYGRLSLVLAIYNTVWIIGASGVPSAVARQIALIAPSRDDAVIGAAARAALAPVLLAAVVVAVATALVLGSPVDAALAAAGLAALVYSLLGMGILRGRGHAGLSAWVMPVTALAELLPLLGLLALAQSITPTRAFAAFCAGNVIGLAVAFWLVRTTTPTTRLQPTEPTPGARELLGFSSWLAAATLSVALLPLAMRAAAALDSYQAVAVVDLAILLLALPQRLGTVILFAVVPHAARELRDGRAAPRLGARAHLLVLPFAAAALVLAATPIAREGLATLGHSPYAAIGPYLALALLAAPARVLYGLVEGVLIAAGQGRFLALAAGATTLACTAGIFAAAALGSVLGAFALFVGGLWAIYVLGAHRLARFSAAS